MSWTTDKAYVKLLQRALLAAGYDPKGVDGIFGRNTKLALIAFQTAKQLPIQFPGTVGPTTLKALGLDEDPKIVESLTTPPWILLARQKIGLHEKLNNKKLRDWLKSDGRTLGDPAKLPWCGDFMETLIAMTLPNEPMLENPYWALNWTKFGVPIQGDIVPLGAIAPFRRPGGGHIATLVGHNKTYYHCLGGNQSNSISIVKIAKSRLEGRLRWPKTYALPNAGMPYTTLNASISRNEA